MQKRPIDRITFGYLAAILLGGCASGMDEIDARLARVLGDRSQALGGGAISPDRDHPDGPFDSPTQDRVSPSSDNPPASQLRYSPADEARDVAARLDSYERDPASPSRAIDLPEAWRIAHRSGREFLSAEEDYIFAAIRLLSERHRWGPRLFNDTSATLSGEGDDGRFESAVRVLNELRATQRLPYGGEVAARWVWDATEQLRSQATGRYRQSSLLALDVDIPLLRGAGLVAREDLIQAERNLVYQARTFEDFRRRFLVSIAGDYFELLRAQAQIANQRRLLDSAMRLEEQARAQAAAGRIPPFEVGIAANRVYSARAALQGQQESYRLALDRFKVRLGLSISEALDVRPLELVVPEPETTELSATESALEYRLDLQNRRDQVDDARRAVRIAKNQILPNLDASGSVGVPTDPDAREGGLVFDPDDLSYSAGITFGLPLDREIERLALRQSVIQLQQNQRQYEQFRDEVVVSVRSAVRRIDLARSQFNLAEQQVEVNRRRLEEIELKADQVDTQRKLDALNELLDSENARDQARTDLRNAVLNYLVESGLLRVARDGTFEALPGMEPRPAEPMPDDPPAGG